MRLKTVDSINSIKQGDTLIITGDSFINKPVKAQIVKVSTSDGVEVIFNKGQNKYFNVGMYLKGESWVKEVCILES